MIPSNEEVMTEKQASEFLQVPESTLRRKRLHGKPGECPPHIIIAGKVRYRKEAILEWMKGQEALEKTA